MGHTGEEGSVTVYHELTVWTRGIIMDKEARDVASCIAAAADSAGFHAQYIADYVDDPDRTNALIRKYTRFGDEPIGEPFVYENPHPDWVVLVEETLIKAVNFFRGTPEGQGVLVVNSARDPEFLVQFLPDFMLAKLKALVVVDAVRLAEQEDGSPWMFVRDLGELARDRTSTEGAPERSEVGIGIAAPLTGALAAYTSVISLDDVAPTVHHTDAMYRGAQDYSVLDAESARSARHQAKMTQSVS
jgi:Pyruvate/2-oxoacid:ferredoxin oxidoreductase gamma subunit